MLEWTTDSPVLCVKQARTYLIRLSIWVSVTASLLTGIACGAGGVRPTFDPLPQAIVDTVAGEPEFLVDRLAELLEHEGIELRWVRVREGYVETEWFDPSTGRAGGGQSLNTVGIIRMRFWTDIALEHESAVVGEAVYRRVIDPSMPIRETEAHVSPEHPGHEILLRIFESLASGSHGEGH